MPRSGMIWQRCEWSTGPSPRRIDIIYKDGYLSPYNIPSGQWLARRPLHSPGIMYLSWLFLAPLAVSASVLQLRTAPEDPLATVQATLHLMSRSLQLAWLPISSFLGRLSMVMGMIWRSLLCTWITKLVRQWFSHHFLYGTWSFIISKVDDASVYNITYVIETLFIY